MKTIKFAGTQEQRELQLKECFEKFFKENNHYPTIQEIARCDYFPTTRKIQRRYGGVKVFRAKYNLGQIDFTKGEYRSRIVKDFNVKGHIEENKIFDLLVQRYGREKVHREYLITDDRRHRADFYVFAKKHFVVECFYPKDFHSFSGCLFMKIKKYTQAEYKVPVILLQLNDLIPPERIKSFVTNRKNPLPKPMVMMCRPEFIEFISVL